jgi:hypothetical protein
MDEVEKLNAICFWLIKKCRETNADTMTITQENVTYLKEPLGNWEIIVRKKQTPA